MHLIESIDFSLMNWLRSVESPALDVAMTWISSSGGGGLLWLTLAIIAFVRPRDRAAAWRVMLTVALCYVVVDGIAKPLVGRSRPTPLATAAKRELPPMPRTYSFPSGHAASTFGAAVSVSRMWPQTRVVWWTLAILIGYSRVYLGHHYPLDVIGGGLLGIGIAFWVLGGRHPATSATTLPASLPAGVIIRP
jgi:undecaprenyl-diphosphatase